MKTKVYRHILVAAPKLHIMNSRANLSYHHGKLSSPLFDMLTEFRFVIIYKLAVRDDSDCMSDLGSVTVLTVNAVQ